MKLKPREAREHLLKALAALDDPQTYCKQNDAEAYANDLGAAKSFVIGAARFRIEFALQLLGEPIDPYRPHEAGPYVRPVKAVCKHGNGPACTQCIPQPASQLEGNES